MKIAHRKVGPDFPPFTIAEISGNHLGKISHAFALIQAAKDTGASAVKFQCYTPDSITINHDGPGFVLKDGPWTGRKLYDLYQEAHTPRAWFSDLFDCARELEIPAFASVFDKESVDFLEGFDPPAYKISSFDIIDTPLIKHVVKTGKPIILSTGMASYNEIREADNVIPPDYPHIFLHCVSGYPTPVEEANLGRMRDLAKMLAMPVGISDHSLGNEVCCAAVALGACVIEKHLTLSRAAGGPDAAFSLEPAEFESLVMAVQSVWKALRFDVSTSESSSSTLRKSIYIVEDLPAGSLLNEKNCRVIRPAFGLPPRFYPEVLTKRARVSLAAGSPVSWDVLE